MKLLFALFGHISDEAYEMLLGTLRVCCVMLFCSLTLLLRAGTPTPDTYALYRTAADLQSQSAALLLIGNFAALFLEGFHRR